MKTIRPVKVKWTDSIHGAGWNDHRAASTSRPTKITTVGYLLERDKDRVVVAQSVSDDTEELGNLLTIPRAAVRSIKRL